MGNKLRRSQGSATDQEVSLEESPLDLKLAEAIQQKVQREGSSVKSFDGLMMKFPQLEKGFTKAQQLFQQIDTNKDGTIDILELKNAAHLLGMDSENGALITFFQAADIDDSQRLEINEFIVLLAICSLLGDNGSNLEHMDDDILNCLKIVEAAFFYFDSSSDGYMDKSEVFKALDEPGVVEKRQSDGEIRVGSQRFAELDWDNSGKIGFKEFLLGVQKWVMVDDDEDE
eukprot:TRINITY_DN11201_c0_g1_i1.p1 TRINITY_DN11201_c0_g1~~TRINITY_DN11201_c0_g1_i1.p1  ORF type:complete len:229 (-),score=46.00 TRINITY_DN11201_c0_g1_i1:278-964(-)